MELNEIKQQKKLGDIAFAAQMVGITQYNAAKALERVKSRYHKEMVDALTIIIETRNILTRATL